MVQTLTSEKCPDLLCHSLCEPSCIQLNYYSQLVLWPASGLEFSEADACPLMTWHNA